MQKLNLTNFNDKIQEEKINLIMMHTEWCSSCRQIFPLYEKLSKDEKYEKYGFYDLDMDECLDLAETYKVDELPVVIAFKKGKEVSRWTEPAGTLESWLNFLSW